MQAALIAWITIRLWTHFLAYNPDFMVLASALLEFVSRVIELILVIKEALLTHRGKERKH